MYEYRSIHNIVVMHLLVQWIWIPIPNRIDLIWFICTDWISGSIDFHLFASYTRMGKWLYFLCDFAAHCRKLMVRFLRLLSYSCTLPVCIYHTSIPSTRFYMFIRLLFPCLCLCYISVHSHYNLNIFYGISIPKESRHHLDVNWIWNQQFTTALVIMGK